MADKPKAKPTKRVPKYDPIPVRSDQQHAMSGGRDVGLFSVRSVKGSAPNLTSHVHLEGYNPFNVSVEGTSPHIKVSMDHPKFKQTLNKLAKLRKGGLGMVGILGAMRSATD